MGTASPETNRATGDGVTPHPTPSGGADHGDPVPDDALKRTLTLPWLVFYGVGVTVGAGIFALVGEIVGLSGRNAPLAFVVAGSIAGMTALCYTRLIALYPRAGGEAVYANRGLGRLAGRAAGFGVVATGTISSAVVALAFAGYVRSLVSLPETLVVMAVVVGLGMVAVRGVRESVALAAVITVIEVGTLLVVLAYGWSALGDFDAVVDAFTPVGEGLGLGPVLAGAVVAFFAFVGFEDIANMAEETVSPRRTGPRAIVITLVVTIVLYVLLATVAVLSPAATALSESSAPMSVLFEAVSGHDGRIISVIAVVAMVNGVLVQIVMASRVLFGMAREGLAPGFFATVDPVRKTPIRATVAVVVGISLLALFFPLVGLARATSLVTLGVFTLVDLSLFSIGTRNPELGVGRWRWVGLLGAVLAMGLATWELVL